MANVATQGALQQMMISKVIRCYLLNDNLEIDKLERFFELSQEGFCIINSE